MHFQRCQEASLAKYFIFLGLLEKKYQHTHTLMGKSTLESFDKLQKKDLFFFFLLLLLSFRSNPTLFKESVASNCIYITLIHSLIKAPEIHSGTRTQNN